MIVVTIRASITTRYVIVNQSFLPLLIMIIVNPSKTAMHDNKERFIVAINDFDIVSFAKD